jgi:hypothetical protein
MVKIDFLEDADSDSDANSKFFRKSGLPRKQSVLSASDLYILDEGEEQSKNMCHLLGFECHTKNVYLISQK